MVRSDPAQVITRGSTSVGHRDQGSCAATPPPMTPCRSEYDRSVNSFSPEGRIFQVEYAIEAIKLGSTAIAVCTSEGVVLAAEKRITSSLLVSKRPGDGHWGNCEPVAQTARGPHA